MLFDDLVDIDGLLFGELLVLDLGEKQQGLVELGEPLNGSVDGPDVLQLLLVQVFRLQKHLRFGLHDGQRGLHLVRGVLRELLQVVEVRNDLVGQPGQRLVQLLEFVYARFFQDNGLVLLHAEILDDLQVLVEGQPGLPHNVRVHEIDGEHEQEHHDAHGEGDDKDIVLVAHQRGACDDPIGPVVQVLDRGQLPVELVFLNPADHLVDQGVLEIEGVPDGCAGFVVFHVEDGKRVVVFDLLGDELLVPLELLVLLGRGDPLEREIDDRTRNDKDQYRVGDVAPSCFLD